MALVGAGNFIYYFTRQARGKRLTTAVVVVGMVILAFAIAIMVNWLANRYNRGWDLTSTKMYSISPKTKQVVQNLQSPVRFVHVYYSTEGQYRLVKKYLEQYQAYNPSMVKVEQINPDRDLA
ncbi:MAG: Gldg family protein [Planctomycetota bacterium]|nr:Gldg family protein [Planctomycetota bacterium]